MTYSLDIPSFMDRRDGRNPHLNPVAPVKGGRRTGWKMPKKAAPKKKAPVKPTDAQVGFLRDMGYKVADIKTMSSAKAQRLIDNNVAPHVAAGGK